MEITKRTNPGKSNVMRVRISFSKTEGMRYVGHLDLFRAWERIFRRSGLPLVYSQGFHPQPRMNLACALPLGFTSEAEILDAWLEQKLPLRKMHEAIEHTLPTGLAILDIQEADIHAPPMQTQVISSVYLITFLDPIPDIEKRVLKILSAQQLPRTRRGKPYDLRPLVEDLAVLPADEAGLDRLQVQLSTHEAATGRPEELLAEMGIGIEAAHIHRQKLMLC